MTPQNDIETELRTAIDKAQRVLYSIHLLIDSGQDVPAEVIEALVGVASQHLSAADVIPF